MPLAARIGLVAIIFGGIRRRVNRLYVRRAEGRAKKMNYKAYKITTFEREPGKWRATISRLDGRMVTCQGKSMPQFDTGADATEDYSIELAKVAIDGGHVQ
jgi:hypothetical protein